VGIARAVGYNKGMNANRIYKIVYTATAFIGTGFMTAYLVTQKQSVFGIGKWLMFTFLAMYLGQYIFFHWRGESGGNSVPDTGSLKNP
jgi:hypothetical protein